MLVLSPQLERASIMSLQSGTSLGVVADPIIDPRKLQVVAYYVTGPRVDNKSVLHSIDIREIGPLGLIVDSADSIMALDQDLVRLQEIIQLNFKLIGKPVYDDQKNRLGKINEYTLETDGFYIQKLHISQSVLKNIKSSNLIIHRSQIIEVTDQKIVVRSATVQEHVGLAQVLNPFRKNSQALTSKTNS